MVITWIVEFMFQVCLWQRQYLFTFLLTKTEWWINLFKQTCTQNLTEPRRNSTIVARPYLLLKSFTVPMNFLASSLKSFCGILSTSDCFCSLSLLKKENSLLERLGVISNQVLTFWRNYHNIQLLGFRLSEVSRCYQNAWVWDVCGIYLWSTTPACFEASYFCVRETLDSLYLS